MSLLIDIHAANLSFLRDLLVKEMQITSPGGHDTPTTEELESYLEEHRHQQHHAGVRLLKQVVAAQRYQAAVMNLSTAKAGLMNAGVILDGDS